MEQLKDGGPRVADASTLDPQSHAKPGLIKRLMQLHAGRGRQLRNGFMVSWSLGDAVCLCCKSQIALATGENMHKGGLSSCKIRV